MYGPVLVPACFLNMPNSINRAIITSERIRITELGSLKFIGILSANFALRNRKYCSLNVFFKS
jgi:hypothetical protein